MTVQMLYIVLTDNSSGAFRWYSSGVPVEFKMIECIGIAVLHSGCKTTKLQFIAAHHQIVVGERIKLNANTIEKLSFYKGKLTMHKVPSNCTRKYPPVQVEFMDSKLDFIIDEIKLPMMKLS